MSSAQTTVTYSVLLQRSLMTREAELVNENHLDTYGANLLHGKTNSADAAVVTADMVIICKDLEDYGNPCMFNLVGTGSFVNLLPRCTYIFQHENRIAVREKKATNYKRPH